MILRGDVAPTTQVQVQQVPCTLMSFAHELVTSVNLLRWHRWAFVIAQFTFALLIFQNCGQYTTVDVNKSPVNDGSGDSASNGSSDPSNVQSRQSWKSSAITSCKSGYLSSNNSTCLASYVPTISVSSMDIAPGSSVQLQWQGGDYASTCVFER